MALLKSMTPTTSSTLPSSGTVEKCNLDTSNKSMFAGYKKIKIQTKSLSDKKLNEMKLLASVANSDTSNGSSSTSVSSRVQEQAVPNIPTTKNKSNTSNVKPQRRRRQQTSNNGNRLKFSNYLLPSKNNNGNNSNVPMNVPTSPQLFNLSSKPPPSNLIASFSNKMNLANSQCFHFVINPSSLPSTANDSKKSSKIQIIPAANLITANNNIRSSSNSMISPSSYGTTVTNALYASNTTSPPLPMKGGMVGQQQRHRYFVWPKNVHNLTTGRELAGISDDQTPSPISTNYDLSETDQEGGYYSDVDMDYGMISPYRNFSTNWCLIDWRRDPYLNQDAHLPLLAAARRPLLDSPHQDSLATTKDSPKKVATRKSQNNNKHNSHVEHGSIYSSHPDDIDSFRLEVID